MFTNPVGAPQRAGRALPQSHRLVGLKQAAPFSINPWDKTWGTKTPSMTRQRDQWNGITWDKQH